MDVAQRIMLCRIIEEIENHESYSKKIGIQNKSMWKDTNQNSEKCGIIRR